MNLIALSKCIRRGILSLFLFSLAFGVSAQTLTIVSVTASGYGANEAEALIDAVINGVAQINGEALASSMRMKTKDTASSNGQERSVRVIEESLSRNTKGVVKSWKKISASRDQDVGFTATAVVNVVVLQQSAQLKRKKLAIVSADESHDALTGVLISEVTQLLTSSRKFAIMDRHNDRPINEQLDRIRRGGSLDDRARLSVEVAPDFIAVVGLARHSLARGYIVEATIEVIDYATRQIKFAEKKRLPFRDGNVAVEALRINMLAKGLARAVLQHVYPPVVVGFNNGIITIAQGADFFSLGDKLIIKQIGRALRDPHTKEFLAYEQTDIGEAEITFVDKRIALAKLKNNPPLTSDGLTNKRYQAWRIGENQGDFFPTITGSGGSKPDLAQKIFVSGDADDDD